MTEPITRFDGKYRWLSNFWACFVTLDGAEYQSTEAAYQAAKTLDPAARVPFQAYFASKAKDEGKKLALRADWESVKLGVMTDLVRQKFVNSDELRTRLLDTGDAQLVETNSWGDVFYGRDATTGEGQNHLGRILMRVRDELRPKTTRAAVHEGLLAERAQIEKQMDDAKSAVRDAETKEREILSRIRRATADDLLLRAQGPNALTTAQLREAIADAARDHGWLCGRDGKATTTDSWILFRELLKRLAARAEAAGA